jgi:DNA-binding response OmpR family regulator
MNPIDDLGSKYVPKIFVMCDRTDSAHLWEYILRQQGLIAIVETDIEKATETWLSEMPELIVIDVDKQAALALCKELRSMSVAPILLFLPEYQETEILAAYTAGVDDVLVKPISHTIFIPKILAWTRRARMLPLDSLNLVRAGTHRLDPGCRCFVGPNDVRVKLTNLEFRLLHLLMSRPAHVFAADDIVASIWGGYTTGNHILLKNVVYRLRKKIESDPSNPALVLTGPGGYSFQE